MDNLTHTLTGVMLSRAGLNRLAPRATLTLLLAANAPDIDVVTRAWGSLAYLRHHRGLTHAVVAAPVLAALVVALVWLLSRRSGEDFSWGRSYLIALAGVASNVLMDFTNTYGVRPWLPLSNTWYSWDISFIIDVWLWVALLACLAVPAVGRLISGEIGARPGSGRGAAVFALLFILAWWGARDLFHRRALALLDAHVYGLNPAAYADSDAARQRPGASPLRVAAFPSPTNPLMWRGFVETEGFYQILPVNVLQPLDPTSGKIFYKPEATPALEAALRTRTASQFTAFARYMFSTVDHREDGYQVVLTDFRFREERRAAFVATIVLDRDLRVIREDFSF